MNVRATFNTNEHKCRAGYTCAAPTVDFEHNHL